MFRFFYMNDELERVANTFYFCTDRYFLAPKGHGIFQGETVEKLLEAVKTFVEETEFERIETLIRRAIEQREMEFQTYLNEVEEQYQRLMEWKGKREKFSGPLGPGFVFNPVDPKKGSKKSK